ncbi:2OG-Fe(II) oxygenase [Robertkochia aurantiaca]|uniref:2OG-Fe(II) oxygenase n=1 Tax=Robertkochia aurantiaca TaxID=2873700 RepID=UPI001CCA4773|nr:2OG-Fe(II) oxygenase [Robertkochia sp. 3YJGBD-33]
MTTVVREQTFFGEELLFEQIITDLLQKHYCVTDQFFDYPTVLRLRRYLEEKYEAEEFRKSAVGNQFNEQVVRSIRGDFIHWIDENEDDEGIRGFFDRVDAMTAYLNRHCFLGLRDREFHFAVYPEGTFYKRHLDTFQNDDRRRLSMVCYLNDREWQEADGGALAIYTDSPEGEQETVIYPAPGRVVIFESQVLEHEVRSVGAEKRLSITGWLKTL